MLGGRVISHDIYKKNYTVREYNYFDDDDFGKHMVEYQMKKRCI